MIFLFVIYIMTDWFTCTYSNFYCFFNQK